MTGHFMSPRRPSRDHVYLSNFQTFTLALGDIFYRGIPNRIHSYTHTQANLNVYNILRINRL